MQVENFWQWWHKKKKGESWSYLQLNDNDFTLVLRLSALITNSEHTACNWGKGFHILWLSRERSTHIMFCAWDYYLDDLCSVITLHVTVQRCSPNINSPMLPPHGCERTVKYNWVSRSPYQLFSVGLLTIICNEGKGKTPATAHRLFSCELSSNWVL